MKDLLTSSLLALCLAFSVPVVADGEEEEGFFSRSWRGVKSVFGVEASAEAKARADRDRYEDDDDDDEYERDDDRDKAKDQEKHKGKDRAGKEKDKREKKLKAEADVRTQGRFSAGEIAAIRSVLGAEAAAEAEAEAGYEDQGGKGKGKYKKGKKQKQLPKGLQMKLERGGELPPGWQQKFQRGEVVDADVYAQARTITPATLGDLATVPGTEVIQVGDRVARVLTSTREILDVINVVTGAPPQ